MGQALNVFQTQAQAESVPHVPDPFRTGLGQSGFDGFPVRTLFVEAIHPHFQATQGLLQGFLESPANGHDFPDGLHLGRQMGIGLGEFFEGETGDLGHHVVNGRLKRGRRLATGNFVGQFVQGVTHGQLGRYLGDGEAGGLGGQGGGTGYPGIHLNDDHPAVLGINGELDVRTARIHPNFPQHGDGGVAHDLVFLVRQGLDGGHGDGIPCMHPHGVQIFDGADDDAVVFLVPHHFHFELFPADQGFLNEQFLGRGGFQAPFANGDEFFPVIGNTAARAAQGKGGTDDGGEADHGLNLEGFFHGMGHGGTGGTQTDLGHSRLELFPILGLVDGIPGGADHFHAVLVQHTVLGQVQGAIQRRLAAHGGQQGIGTFLFDNLFHHLPGDGFDIGHVRRGRVGHDGGRIGIDQNDLVTLGLQGLTSLGAGIVELAGLTDDDRARPNDKNAFDVVTLRHFPPFCLASAE